MIVTVYNKVPVAADVAAAKIERYLASKAWFPYTECTAHREWRNEGARCYVTRDGRDEFATATAELIDYLARYEDRQPGDVLSDIAAETT